MNDMHKEISTWTNLKCLKNCKPSVMSNTCGKTVEDEAAEFARAVVIELECEVKKQGQPHAHVACEAPHAPHLEDRHAWFNTLLSPSWNCFNFWTSSPEFSFYTGLHKLWPYLCWVVLTITIYKKKWRQNQMLLRLSVVVSVQQVLINIHE